VAKRIPAFSAWHSFGLALEKFAAMILDHAKICDGEMQMWEHGSVGCLSFHCRRCGLQGRLSAVRGIMQPGSLVEPVPTIDIHWLYETEEVKEAK